MSSQLLETALPRRHDAVYDVIKDAGGSLAKVSERFAERLKSCWNLPCQDDMMLLMTSSKLLEAAFSSCHDAVHDVIKAAWGRLAKVLERCAEHHQSCWRLPFHDNMMLLMTSSKLLQAAFPGSHDAAHDVIKAAWCAPPLKHSTISWASSRTLLLATFVPQMLAGQGDIFSTLLENLKYVIYWQNYIICHTIIHKEYHSKLLHIN
jgi:hypothetical protein